MKPVLQNELRFVVGDAGVLIPHARSPFLIDGHAPSCVVQPSDRGELRRVLGFGQRYDLSVVACGNGTMLGVGVLPRRYDIAVTTINLMRIVAHEAADMTVTAEAGVTLEALNRRLAQAGQYLPLDPPLPSQVTVGGLIAADQWGAWRSSQGKVRDLLLGITVALHDGRLVHAGGRVVKNVAGYDLMKLFTGSWGTLGVVIEATFKVRPLPPVVSLFVLASADISSACGMAASLAPAGVHPHFATIVDAAAARPIAGRDQCFLMVACAGLDVEVDVQRERLTALIGAGRIEELDSKSADKLYTTARDFPATAVAEWGARISLLPTNLKALLAELPQLGIDDVALVVQPLSGVAILRGREWIGPEKAHALRAAVRARGGYLVFDRLAGTAKPRIDVWGEDIPGIELMRQIKRTLDPQERLSPGRFVGGI